MRQLFKEPLFHFLLIGAAIFLLYSRFAGVESREDIIVVDDSDIDRMINTWEMQWQRPPTQKELNNLVAQHLRQEVYYREALKMQLDHNDEIVKRRLHQKMEFLMDDIAEMEPPSREELQEYLQDHRGKYRKSPRVTLRSIYFNPDKREDPEADAVSALKLLAAGTAPEELGDASSLTPIFQLADEHEISRLMGRDFAAEVLKLEAGDWQGPVPSGLGQHLVLISKKVEGRDAELDEVIGKVTADFIYDRQQEYAESIYERMQKNYKVVFDFKDPDRDSIQIRQNE